MSNLTKSAAYLAVSALVAMLGVYAYGRLALMLARPDVGPVIEIALFLAGVTFLAIGAVLGLVYQAVRKYKDQGAPTYDPYGL